MAEDAVRVGLLDQLVDWDGADLRKVYEPISWQIGNIYCAVVAAMFIAWMWSRYKKQRAVQKIQYKFTRQLLVEEGDKNKRTCSVIGGTGVLGNSLVNSLVTSGQFHVHVVSRRIPPKTERNPEVDAYVRLDISDYDSIFQALDGVDSVFYCVCGLPDVYTDDEDTWSINKTGAENLISACLERGVKNLVFTSVLTEQTQVDLKKCGVFLKSRLLAEQAIFQHTKSEKLNVCIVGLGKMYSKEDSTFLGYGREELKWFPQLPVTYNYTDVSTAVSMLIALEQRLHSQCPLLLKYQMEKKKIVLSGAFHGSLKEFADHYKVKQWFKAHSTITITTLARLNKLLVRFTGWAPFGTALAPELIEVLKLAENKPSPDQDLTILFNS